VLAVAATFIGGIEGTNRGTCAMGIIMISGGTEGHGSRHTCVRADQQAGYSGRAKRQININIRPSSEPAFPGAGFNIKSKYRCSDTLLIISRDGWFCTFASVGSAWCSVISPALLLKLVSASTI